MVAAAWGFVLPAPSVGQAPDRPNMVVILADDKYY
jgi:hypothetical protein